jgi:hypothetical protein
VGPRADRGRIAFPFTAECFAVEKRELTWACLKNNSRANSEEGHRSETTPVQDKEITIASQEKKRTKVEVAQRGSDACKPRSIWSVPAPSWKLMRFMRHLAPSVPRPAPPCCFILLGDTPQIAQSSKLPGFWCHSAVRTPDS